MDARVDPLAASPMVLGPPKTVELTRRGVGAAFVGALLAPGCSPVPRVPAADKAASSIVAVGAPVLRTRARAVSREELGTAAFRALVDTMLVAMRRAPGVGLAAPQVGVSLRVLVLEDTADRMSQLSAEEIAERERVPVPARVIVNPVLRRVGDGRATFFEGCLSVRGYVALVERDLEVEVSGWDEHGRELRWRVRGWPARILQHEVDHLDGTLYVDRMLTRSLSTPDQAKARFGGKSSDEIRKALGL